MPRIQHVAIRTDNPEQLAKYYEDVFGWTRLRAGGGGGVHLSDGHINIAILRTNGMTPGVEHIGVKVDSMDDVKEGLAKYGVILEPRPDDNRAAEQRVLDPDGNSVDLSVRGFMFTD